MLRSLRPIILVSLLFALSCNSAPPKRSGTVQVGPIQELLQTEQFVREWSLLLHRDERGWSAMDTRCNHDGCELSYQEFALVCLCCESVFDHEGHVVRGPAAKRLPFFKINFQENNLVADLDHPATADERFTTPEIETALAGVRERLRGEQIRPGNKIPAALLGGDINQSAAGMFRDKQDLAVPTLGADAQPPADLPAAPAMSPQPSPSLMLDNQ